jgi:hypothetical protein
MIEKILYFYFFGSIGLVLIEAFWFRDAKKENSNWWIGNIHRFIFMIIKSIFRGIYKIFSYVKYKIYEKEIKLKEQEDSKTKELERISREEAKIIENERQEEYRCFNSNLSTIENRISEQDTVIRRMDFFIYTNSIFDITNMMSLIFNEDRDEFFFRDFISSFSNRRYKKIIDFVFGELDFSKINLEKMNKYISSLRWHHSVENLISGAEKSNSNFDKIDKLKKSVNEKIKQISRLEKDPIYMLNCIFKRSQFGIDLENVAFENSIIVLDIGIPTVKDVIQEISIGRKKKLTKKQLSSICSQFHPSLAVAISKFIVNNLSQGSFEHLVLNLNADTIVPSSGKKERKCVFSIMLKYQEIVDFELKTINPLEAANYLKSRMQTFGEKEIAVEPIYSIKDDRVVETKDVASKVVEGFNLAAMDWEDFEHLVTQLFERLYAERGGVVATTQRSADGGVDAILHEPTPSGGIIKIVIQAKRHTNLIAPSDVRDLFGTVTHENAGKGILVTTSYFGPEAIEFAGDHNIELIDGKKLIELINKVGMGNFKIDIQEAKKIIKASKKEN